MIESKKDVSKADILKKHMKILSSSSDDAVIHTFDGRCTATSKILDHPGMNAVGTMTLYYDEEKADIDISFDCPEDFALSIEEMDDVKMHLNDEGNRLVCSTTATVREGHIEDILGFILIKTFFVSVEYALKEVNEWILSTNL